jgi:hypothetical protein
MGLFDFGTNTYVYLFTYMDNRRQFFCHRNCVENRGVLKHNTPLAQMVEAGQIEKTTVHKNVLPPRSVCSLCERLI